MCTWSTACARPRAVTVADWPRGGEPGGGRQPWLGWRFTNPAFAAHDAGAATGARKITLSMGETAEELAALDGITREESDAFALRSHQRAVNAREAGRFDAAVLERVQVVGTPAELPGDVALVIEAVPELPGVKAGVLAATERVVGPRCVIASNTSSLSITALARALELPGRFVGMHFFNPVPASSLVEIVTGEATGADAIEQAARWTRTLGKNEVVVRDSPGFATSRLGVLLGLEAIRMVEEGVAGPDEIDRAMELGYRHPMGPLRSTDLVGLDVRLNIAEHLATALGPRFEPPALLRDKVARGELGRKTGQGFYRWER
jgi:3-hydroxybutyryl-CoA dehydrogenase